LNSLIATSEYLVGYGKNGEFGRFAASFPAACRRGEPVVVETVRGLELGTVIRPTLSAAPTRLADLPLRRLVRLPRSDDLQAAKDAKARSRQLFTTARTEAGRLALPLEIIDAEVLLEGRQAFLHYLAWAPCAASSLVESLRAQHDILIMLHDLALPALPDAHEDEEAHGCGSCGAGGCGSGGCGTCSSGGCGSCASGHAPVLESHSHKQDERVSLL
jgi:hypothetical protein